MPKSTANNTAYLVLSDGTVFPGRSFGADGEVAGEVVFNTSMTGYQEILTDPSYCGQILTMTAPHIGNVGINPEDVESSKPRVGGLIVCDYCASPSNWRATVPLHDYLQRHRIVAVEGLDTRALTRHIRLHGAMPGILTTRGTDLAPLRVRAGTVPAMDGQNLVDRVTCKAAYEWTESSARQWFMTTLPIAGNPHILVYDFGVKQNILRCLVANGARVTVVPATTSAETALAAQPDGILLSNGPGDPAAVGYAVATIRQLIGRVPLFGICLGHQLLGLALGGRTFKLKFGHHGANQPVQDCRTGKVAVTAQNHGFSVDAGTLPAHVEVTHWNVNDRTVEGFASRQERLFACQYHPEASPGPHDANGVFAEFLSLCQNEPISIRS